MTAKGSLGGTLYSSLGNTYDVRQKSLGFAVEFAKGLAGVSKKDLSVPFMDQGCFFPSACL